MIRRTLIALTATAALGVTLAPAAQAKTHIDFNLNIGAGILAEVPGFYVVDDGWDEEDCSYVKVKHKKALKNGKIKVWFSKKLICA